ncbi:Arylsulfatase A [Thermomonospora echinospora]|uniref:Arylsulfatase A n=1 Tax=Thermomonospora echinospora TaxID=1992 RepID=A0A1H6E0B6_9ACTN|nr:arylsulfatase [Thermomonospora echinospora]SEG90901.1 Arylsulfatase A [Thermomonospora echinospora]
MNPERPPAGPRVPRDSRRRFLLTAAAATVVPAGAAVAAWPALGSGRTTASPAPSPARRRRRSGRPNFVVVVADDLGYGELGGYGQTQIRTPRLDRLAAEGVRFTDFYAGAPVCAPSRCSLLTGRHIGRARVRTNPKGPDSSLTDADLTFGKVLQEAGYRTGLFGKWGFGPAEPDQPSHPHAQGFGEFFGYLTHGEAHRYFPPALWDGRRSLPLPANRPRARNVYAPELIVRRGLDFVDRHRDEPFLLVLTPPLPHAPSIAPSPFPYRARTWARPDRAHAAQVTLLDSYVGRLVDRLTSLGLADDTVVLFTSDNGPHEEGGFDPDFFHASGGLRGYKRSLYEGGIRVPLIAWSPGLLGRGRGRVSSHPSAMWDLFPTITDLAGLGPPDEVDGRSLRGLLTGTGGPPRRDYLYWARPNGAKPTPRVAAAEGEHAGRAAAAVRFGRWKAVGFAPGRHYFDPDDRWSYELYDLWTDPGERTDVAASRPEILDQAIRYLHEAWVPPA